MSLQEPQDRMGAQQALAVAPAPNVEALLKAWQEEEKSKRQPRQLLSLFVAFLGCVMLLVGINQWAEQRQNLLLMLGCGVTALSGLIWQAFPVVDMTQQQIEIRDQIDRLNDVRAVGPLIDVLYEAPSLHKVTVSTLNRLLGGLNGGTAVDLLNACGPQLCRLTTWNRSIDPMETNDADLVIAILRLLPAWPDRLALYCTNAWMTREAPTHHEQRIRQAAGDTLSRLLNSVDLGGAKALPHWIDGLPTFENPGRDAIAPLAFIQQLPQLSPADYLALNTKDRQRIYASLFNLDAPRLKAQYTLVVLDMVRRSVDVEALSVVESLIHSSSPHVREAARECLPLLTAQVEKEKLGKTLLRGASAPQSSGKTLLRPATGAHAADPQLLLRADPAGGTGRQDR